ncbi:metalloregulator ArsR/SmtB family transcription factor [Streptosporangium canum]|uniref:ArsR/SmtB family transcription factor n=1 Tax=Streptosporangium canum TaxID=324952 RepID=UPI003444E1C1
MSQRSSVEAPVTSDACSTLVVDAERVESVQQTMPSEEVVQDLAQIFGLLADPGRLRMMAALLGGGEMCVCDLAAVTGQSMSAASQALRLLRMHHVVKVRRFGRMAYYRLADSHVRMLFDVAITHIGHGEGQRNDG